MSIRDWAAIRKALINGDSYNSEVVDHFGDTSTNPQREAVKNLCLVQSNDSVLIAQQRIRFFREEVQKCHLKPVIIGQPKSDFDADVKYHPQVTVYFVQDIQSVPRGSRPKNARVTWRLMDQTSETISNQILNNWATKVYNSFFNPVYSFHKGKYIGWYNSPADGLHLQLYCLDDITAESVAKKIVTSADKTFNDDLFKVTKPKRNNIAQSQQITILGQSKSVPNWRPNITVNVAYAYINIWADNDLRLIVDKIGSKFHPILRQ